MDYPHQGDEYVFKVCSLKGVVYITPDIQIAACCPTDEALACLYDDDINGARKADIWSGKNVWVIQWYGEGVKGVREALAHLGKFVGEGGVLAGNRNGQKRHWTKEWLDKRSK